MTLCQPKSPITTPCLYVRHNSVTTNVVVEKHAGGDNLTANTQF